MKRQFFTAVVFLSAAAFVQPVTHAASNQVPTAVKEQPSATLFQASFKRNGLKGWSTGFQSTWRVQASGVLAGDSSDAYGEVLAPVSVKGVRDFAVYATIESVGSADNSLSGYGLVVRTKQMSPGKLSPIPGIHGGSFFSTDNAFNEPTLWWSPDDVAGTSPALHPGYNAYRLEVHGTDYSLIINNQEVINFPISEYSGNVRVGLWAESQKIRVRSFRVVRLQPTTPIPALPPLKALNLGPADVPTGVWGPIGHYYTNQELERLDRVSIAYWYATGRVLGYRASFETTGVPSAGIWYVDSLLESYTSPEKAQAAFTGNRSAYEKQHAGASSYASGDMSGVGEEAYQLRYDAADVTKYSRMCVGFRRGAYWDIVCADFIQGTVSQTDMLAQATALAKIVDGRIQQAGSARSRATVFGIPSVSRVNVGDVAARSRREAN